MAQDDTAAETPDPIVTPVTSIPTTPSTGWWTSEHIVMLIAIALTSILSSNLITDDRWVKIIGIVLDMLGALGYGAFRTQLKVAHVRAAATIANDNAVTATMTARRLSRAAGASAALLFIALGACSSTSTAVKQAGGDLSTCARADVNQLVPGVAVSLLTDVSQILANGQPDYTQQLDSLATTVEKLAVDCAVKTAVDVFSTIRTNAAGDTPATRGLKYMQARGIK